MKKISAMLVVLAVIFSTSAQSPLVVFNVLGQKKTNGQVASGRYFLKINQPLSKQSAAVVAEQSTAAAITNVDTETVWGELRLQNHCGITLRVFNDGGTPIWAIGGQHGVYGSGPIDGLWGVSNNIGVEGDGGFLGGNFRGKNGVRGTSNSADGVAGIFENTAGGYAASFKGKALFSGSMMLDDGTDLVALVKQIKAENDSLKARIEILEKK